MSRISLIFPHRNYIDPLPYLNFIWLLYKYLTFIVGVFYKNLIKPKPFVPKILEE